MSRFHILGLISMFAILLVSCGKKGNDYSLDEFAEAVGVVYWKIHIPEDLGEDEVIGTVWFVGEEPGRPDNDFYSARPGSVVKAFLWADDEPPKLRFRYIEISADGTRTRSRAHVTVPDGGYTLSSYQSTGHEAVVGETLLTVHRGPYAAEDKRELKLVRRNRAH